MHLPCCDRVISQHSTSACGPMGMGGRVAIDGGGGVSARQAMHCVALPCGRRRRPCDQICGLAAESVVIQLRLDHNRISLSKKEATEKDISGTCVAVD